MRLFILATASLALLTGCASTQTIAPQYINPNTYTSYDCATLNQEINRISKLADSTEKQQSTLAASGIGIGLTGGRHGIYPTVSFGLGQSTSGSQKRQTLSKLYGEHDAMVLAARQKNCSFANSIKIYGE